MTTDKLMNRKEVAAYLGVSYDAIATKSCGTECLMEIRGAGRCVQFNPQQIIEHREAVWTYGRCNGRCKAALQPKRLKLAS